MEARELSLPRDYSRCRNSDCELKNNCLRWLDRENGYVFTDFQPKNGKCNNQIKPQ